MKVSRTMSELAKETTLTITIKNDTRFRFRLWLFVRLLRMLSWVCPFRTIVEKESSNSH